MVKVYEEKTYPARTEKVCVKRQCDLCGFTVPGDEWDRGMYKINETEVLMCVSAKKG